MNLRACISTLALVALASAGMAHSSPSESLMRKLRKSFGPMHDVVSRSALMVSSLGGTLTKPQLEADLEQRAIVNEAVDRILAAASIRPLPYGAAQKNVLTLLRNDLADMGDPWPLPAQAWPLTQEMLDKIQASVAKGPYYALGVFHIYYGGITHGGRDIGQTIDRHLNTHLTYYQKSDGYDNYAKVVNEIWDPKAQREMIRGADDAYRYIIAFNNLPIFRSSKSVAEQ